MQGLQPGGTLDLVVFFQPRKPVLHVVGHQGSLSCADRLGADHFVLHAIERGRLVFSLHGGMQWDCYGMHTERGKETVRRVAEMLAGHDLNHLRQIHALLGK